MKCLGPNWRKTIRPALFDLGEGWLALVFMPVNNVASVLVIGLRAMHLAWKKLISASFGS